MMNQKEKGNLCIEGYIKIYDPSTDEIFVDKRNAIHYENFSIALAQAVSNQDSGFIGAMSFGNGGTSIDPTGIITYRTPNTIGSGSSLYAETYVKSVDPKRSDNTDPARNYMEVRHRPGAYYSDVLVSCLLDFGEPTGQNAFDNSSALKEAFTFDEIGLRSYSPAGIDQGALLTHVIFHPVQKSLNRLIQIDYTIRIQSLSSGI